MTRRGTTNSEAQGGGGTLAALTSEFGFKRERSSCWLVKIHPSHVARLLAAGLCAVLSAAPGFAQQTPAPSPSPIPELRTVVDSLTESDLQEVISLLKSNYLNPDALTGRELARATVEGLVARLSPGVSILTGTAPGITGTSPFRSEILDDRIGYVRLGALTNETAPALDAALKNFTDKSLNSVVVDLRATPGSSDFEAAAEIAKRFCPKGTLLFTIKKPNAKPERTFSSNRDPQFQGVIAVLVDRDTTGAPEVIAAVLRAHARALVIGEPTRGQAVEFADLPLHDGKVLRVAEALVILPGNGVIFPEGVKPDLDVRQSPEEIREILKQSLDKGISRFVFETERPKLNEAALVARINPELDAIEAAQGKKPNTKPAPRDIALQRAVDFITTVAFYRK